MVKLILKLEGAALFLTSLYFYHYFRGNWILFVLLLFTPDISMVGYLADKKLGATIYNTVHNFILGLLILFSGAVMRNNLIILAGVILFAHVAWDRFFEYGLKYKTGFKNTHMQKV